MAKTVIRSDQIGDPAFKYKDLFVLLLLRDIKLRYKQTALGIIWVVLQSLLPSLLLAFVLGKFFQISSTTTPYYIYSMAGWIPWVMFSTALHRSSLSLISEAHLITKIYFPRILLPLSACTSVLLDFFISFSLLCILMVFEGIPPSISLLAFPFFIFGIAMLSMGMGLAISALSFYYRDFINTLPFFIQIWMFASPILYPSSLISPEFEWIYSLNPMVGFLNGFRWSLFADTPFPLGSISYSIGLTGILFGVGYRLFKRIEFTIADRI